MIGDAKPIAGTEWDAKGFGINDEGNQSAAHAVTLRDYFAAKAMQAWISNLPEDAMDDLQHASDRVFREHAACVADVAGWYADAMLKERAK